MARAFAQSFLSVVKKAVKSLLPVAGLVLVSTPATAADIKVYRSQNSQGVMTFSDQPPRAGSFKVLYYRCFACGQHNQIDFQHTPIFREKYQPAIAAAAQAFQLDSALIRAVIHAESGFDPNAVSPRGASGLMQLMPATAKAYALTSPFEPAANIMAGAEYLASLLQEFDGKLPLALAAYNAGPASVRRYGGVPPFSETQLYVARVQQLFTRYQQAPIKRSS